MVHNLIFTVTIITKTWLHIWSGNELVEIWWIDQPVVKTRDGFPYIPGSSLKWKLRSLYEIYNIPKEELEKDKKNALKMFDGEYYDEVSMFFGKAWIEINNIKNLWPTRFIFRDLKLKKISDKEIEKGYLGKTEFIKMKYDWNQIFEEKNEIIIDRKQWTSKNWWLRPLERVPFWVIFEWNLIVRLFEKEEILKQWNKETEREILEDKFWKNLSKLKELIEADYLWGQGSRWSGAIEIHFKEKTF